MADDTDEAGDMALGWESAKGMAAKLVQAGLGFTGTIIFARVLGPTSFGGFYFLLTLVMLTNRPLQGLGQALRKRYSETDAPRDRLMGTVLALEAAYFIVVGILVFVFADALTAATNVDGAPVVFVSLLVGIGLFAPFQRMLGAIGLVGKQTWNDTLRSLLTLPLQLLFVSLGYGAAGMGFGLALASVLSVPVAFLFLSARPSLPDLRTLRSLWSYFRYSVPGAIVGKAYDRIDTLLLGVILTTSAVGYYEVALKLTVPATFLPGVVVSGLMPKVSNLASRDESVSSDINNAVAYISVLSVPIFFGALALPRKLVVTPYGAEYAPAAGLLVGLALYQVVASQTRVYQQTLRGLDRPDVALRVDAVTLAFNVAVGVALVLEIGVIGVVIATVLAESLRLALAAWAVSTRVPGLDPLPRPLVEQVAAGSTMFLVVEAISRVTPLATVVDVALVVGIGGMAYVTVLLALSPGHRVTLRSIYRDALAARNA